MSEENVRRIERLLELISGELRTVKNTEVSLKHAPNSVFQQGLLKNSTELLAEYKLQLETIFNADKLEFAHKILKSLKTARFTVDTNANFRLKYHGTITDIESELEKLHEKGDTLR